jgi:hypothetical protein
VEVGVFDGRLSRYLLEHAPTLTLLMVDRWDAVPETHQYAKSEAEMAKIAAEDWYAIRSIAIHNVSPFSGRAVILRAESEDVAKMVGTGSQDFVFIDADHSYEGVKADILLWWPKVRPGGYLCGHDWQHPEGHIDGEVKKWGVEKAVREFFDNHRVEAGSNHTWFVKC